MFSSEKEDTFKNTQTDEELVSSKYNNFLLFIKRKSPYIYNHHHHIKIIRYFHILYFKNIKMLLFLILKLFLFLIIIFNEENKIFLKKS